MTQRPPSGTYKLTSSRPSPMYLFLSLGIPNTYLPTND